MFDLVEFVGRRAARGFPRPGGRIRAGLLVGLVSSAALIAASGAGGGPVAAGAPGPGAARAAHLVAYAGPAQVVHETDPADGVTSGQFDSRNWDGYFTYVASEATDFNSVKASWVEPAVTCPASNAWTVFWVGLDGWWNDTVEQGGSSARCVGGTPQYDLWWEMYPTNGIQLMTGIVVRAGDAIHVFGRVPDGHRDLCHLGDRRHDRKVVLGGRAVWEGSHLRPQLHRGHCRGRRFGYRLFSVGRLPDHDVLEGHPYRPRRAPRSDSEHPLAERCDRGGLRGQDLRDGELATRAREVQRHLAAPLIARAVRGPLPSNPSTS